MVKKLPLISVVICSFNGADVISKALKAIKAQKWAGKLEIIVVDDGSTDDTYKIAKSFRGVKVIKNKANLGTAKSRNVGIKAAKGEIVAFTDDDCRPRPTWIKELHAGYTRDEIMGVGGNLISNERSDLILRYLQLSNPIKPLSSKLLKSNKLIYRFGLYLKDLMGFSPELSDGKTAVYSFATANASFRKSALEEIDGFDERFLFAAEDIDLCKRLNNFYPESLCLAPKAKVIHEFDTSLRDTLRRSQAYGKGNACMSLKYKDVNPTIYPFPFLILTSFLLCFINIWFLLTPFLLVSAIYSLGIRTAVKTRSFEPLLYSYIQCLQELYNDIGIIKGYLKFRNTFKVNSEQARKQTTKLTKSTVNNSLSNRVFDFSTNTNQDNIEKQPEKNNIFWLETGKITLVLILILIATLIKNTTFFQIPSAVAMVLISGYLILRGFRTESERRIPGMLRLALMTTLGIAWIMLFGLTVAIVLPILGFGHPLIGDLLPLVFVVATGLIIPWSLRYKIATRKAFFYKMNWDTLILSSLLTLTLIFSFFGARLLNNGYSNAILIAAFILGLISIALPVLRQKYLPKNIFPVVLFVLSLASVWSYSLRSNYVFGWDINQEFQVFQATLGSGEWILGAKQSMYSAMLSLTILPVIIAKVTGIAGLTIFKVLSPIFFSFVPVILYYIYRLFTKRWVAFLAALLIFVQFNTFISEFSAIVRQQIGFLFFVSILYLLLQSQLSRHTKNSLLVCSILGLVVSHYTTTYIAILFLGGTYIISKIFFTLLRRYKHSGAESHNRYIHGWMLVLLIVSAILWYGPATHSSGYLQKLTSKHEYSLIIQNIGHEIQTHLNDRPYIPKTAKAYLQSIGKQYDNNHNGLSYYPNASNSTIDPVTQPVIKSKFPILKIITDAVEKTLKYLWWVLGGAGILILLFSAYRRLGYRTFELATLGVIGLTTVFIFVLFPGLQSDYSAQRLSEQVLIFTALPSILMLIWLLRSLATKTIKFIITGIILFSFAFTAGLITQFVGGVPSANLNNFGLAYDNYYIYQTDVAASQWLGDRYNNFGSPVYADSYGFLRLISDKYTIYNQLSDVTPETISEGSFIYAYHTNVKKGVATTVLSNYHNLTYQFPTSFLHQNKNLVYSNGNSEVYK